MPSVILKGHKEGYEFILKDVSSFNEIKKEIDEPNLNNDDYELEI